MLPDELWALEEAGREDKQRRQGQQAEEEREAEARRVECSVCHAAFVPNPGWSFLPGPLCRACRAEGDA